MAEHDPVHALFGGADGMAVITPIVTLAAAWLKAGEPPRWSTTTPPLMPPWRHSAAPAFSERSLRTGT